MTPSIFISHSAREPNASALLPELAERLQEAGLDAWYDRERLRLPGFAWRREIDKALHLCRAAIVLVSPSALKSPWVAYETAVLAHRSHIAPGFLLLPMLVAGARIQDLTAAAWEPIALQELQAVSGADTELSMDKVVARLLPLVERFLPDSPAARLENVLVERLARAGSGAQQAAAYRLRIQPRQWEIDLPTALARRLLEVPIEAQFRALSVIADVDREAASAVFRQVAPHGWITAMAAEQVRDAAGRAHGERGLGVNAACVETCNMHVRCAFHAWSTCEVEGNPSDDDIDEFMRRARAALLQWMQHDHDEPEPQDREIDAEVAESQDDLPFLVLPPDAAFSAVLARIRDAWPHVPVMLRCTGDSLEPLAGRGLPHIALLDPPIVPAVEASIIAQHRDYVRRLDRRARG